VVAGGQSLAHQAVRREQDGGRLPAAAARLPAGDQ